MKKGLVILLAVGAVLAGLFFWFQGNYNNMVKMDEGVQAAWSQVENVYQRRADLIPNLVATVKGYAAHEQQTLEGLISARSKATQITIDAENLTPDELAKYQKAQGELGAALGKLLAITENYPELKANENFLSLQSQLEGTENRIAVERKKYNETARNYNTEIRQFPKNIVAGMFGFEKKPYFEAQEGAQQAPVVAF